MCECLCSLVKFSCVDMITYKVRQFRFRNLWLYQGAYVSSTCIYSMCERAHKAICVLFCPCHVNTFPLSQFEGDGYCPWHWGEHLASEMCWFCSFCSSTSVLSILCTQSPPSRPALRPKLSWTAASCSHGCGPSRTPLLSMSCSIGRPAQTTRSE